MAYGRPFSATALAICNAVVNTQPFIDLIQGELEVPFESVVSFQREPLSQDVSLSTFDDVITTYLFTVSEAERPRIN